jgi:hypothetical protein
MAWRLGLGASAAVAIIACGGRTLDYGEFGDYGLAGAGGAGAGKGGKGGATSGGSGGAPVSGGTGPVAGRGGTGSGGAGGKVGGGGGAFGGGAGSPVDCPPPGLGAANPLIDDMEDGDLAILPYRGRRGGWYAYNDMTGMQTGPNMVGLFPARDQSLFAVLTRGNGFVNWGAGIGFNLSGLCPYNASGYAGIRFFAWAGNAVDLRLSINVGTAATTPVANGGTCVSNCWDAHSFPVIVYDAWGFYQIAFSELRQRGFGTPVAFDSTQLLTVQFQVDPGQDFELWIDDVGFF